MVRNDERRSTSLRATDERRSATLRATDRIRNLGIIAHVDAGKTTLTERVLYYTGRIHALGEVHEGTAQTDHHPIEQRKGITILAAAVTCDWGEHRIHLIDTPGHVDFTIEVERSLRVLDGAICVLDGVAGVEPQTQTVWRQADRHGVPRVCFVNKLDRPGADFARCLRELHDRLGARAVALGWPIYDGQGSALVGVVDLVAWRALCWDGGDGASYETRPIPAALLDTLEAPRRRLLEVCADEDPQILEAVLEERAVDPAALWAALRRATVAGRLTPVLCGAAYRNLGVQPLLDAAVALLPSPLDRGAVRAADGTQERLPSRSAPLSALAFKVVFDEHGQMTFVRVYSGALRKGDTVVTARDGRRLRVGRLVRLHAQKTEEVDRLEAGEIGALLGAPIASGDTIADPDAPIALEAIRTPAPVVRVVLEPRTRADWERLPLALQRMHAADPSLRVETAEDTGQTLLAGMGQLHLDIAVERLETEHGVQVRAGQPRVAYRTTLGQRARRELRHAKQTGGPGQFAQVLIEVAPAERGAGLRFVNAVRGGAIPAPFVAAVEHGVRGAMEQGLLGGHPVVDVEVTLLDGLTHPKDSSELAFQIAGARAFEEAAAAAAPVLLEPIMALEVTCPPGSVGAVLGDLGQRRGEIRAQDLRGQEHVVRAEVPLAETFGYAASLSALTRGLGRFTLEPARYERVPAHLYPRIARG